MPGLMSPQELNNDPKRWLDVPHELHEQLLKLMDECLFPGFKKKLEEEHVHCFKCEGKDEFPVIILKTKEGKLCTGLIGDVTKPDSVLLHLEKPLT